MALAIRLVACEYDFDDLETLEAATWLRAPTERRENE